MKKDKVFSFVGGLGLSALVSGIVFCLLVLETMDLFGIDEITDPESRHAKLFYTALAMSLLIATVVALLFISKKKHSTIGVAITCLPWLFMTLKFGIIYFDKSNYYEKFDKQIWSSSKDKPLKMARELVKNKTLIGLTRKEAIQKLGQGKAFNRDNTDYIRYRTTLGYCDFGLVFENGKVRHAGLWVDD